MAPPATDSPWFRAEALEHALRLEEGRGLVRVSPPWTWALLAVLLSALGGALAVAVWGRVELNGRARGILRPRSGVRVLTSRIDGTLGTIAVRSGQAVPAGAVLLRLEAPPIQAQLLEARRAAAAVRLDFRVAAGLQDRAHAEQRLRLDARMDKLGEQEASQRQSLERLARALQRQRTLERAGVASAASVEEAQEAWARAQRELMLTGQGRDQLAQEAAALDHLRQENLWQRRQTIQNAASREEALALLLRQTVLEAPEPGLVEAMLVKPGEAVRAGQALCKLIPGGAPLQAVAFLEERDRAFVRPGDEVCLELDQLPYAEYGTLRARVERISDDLAAPFELQEALGEAAAPGGASFRVELRLTGTLAAARAGVPLRSGMLLNARFTLRRQRLITLLLDPLRKWLR